MSMIDRGRVKILTFFELENDDINQKLSFYPTNTPVCTLEDIKCSSKIVRNYFPDKPADYAGADCVEQDCAQLLMRSRIFHSRFGGEGENTRF